MIDVIPELRTIFKNNGIELIPEDASDSSEKYPCVTYREIENTDNKTGDTLGYSNIAFSFQIWAYKASEIISLCTKTDNIMKEYKFERYMSSEQVFDGLHRKILGYRRIVKEKY